MYDKALKAEFILNKDSERGTLNSEFYKLAINLTKVMLNFHYVVKYNLINKNNLYDINYLSVDKKATLTGITLLNHLYNLYFVDSDRSASNYHKAYRDLTTSLLSNLETFTKFNYSPISCGENSLGTFEYISLNVMSNDILTSMLFDLNPKFNRIRLNNRESEINNGPLFKELTVISFLLSRGIVNKMGSAANIIDLTIVLNNDSYNFIKDSYILNKLTFLTVDYTNSNTGRNLRKYFFNTHDIINKLQQSKNKDLLDTILNSFNNFSTSQYKKTKIEDIIIEKVNNIVIDEVALKEQYPYSQVENTISDLQVAKQNINKLPESKPTQALFNKIKSKAHEYLAQ